MQGSGPNACSPDGAPGQQKYTGGYSVTEVGYKGTAGKTTSLAWNAIKEVGRQFNNVIHYVYAYIMN